MTLRKPCLSVEQVEAGEVFRHTHNAIVLPSMRQYIFAILTEDVFSISTALTHVLRIFPQSL
jgi:hypothetical protein